MYLLERWEREVLRRREEDMGWLLNPPVLLPQINPWERPPSKRAEVLYFSEQVRHTNGAQPR